MKNKISVRFTLTLVLLASMLAPTAVLAGEGAKNFKLGMKHETAERWDEAVESFALAVADNPKNPEYRLHLQRALFMASQMYMKKGATAAGEKDFQGAYIAFRKAYAYDPVNELAKSEMARMIRMQEEMLKAGDPGAKPATDQKVKLVPTSYNTAPATGPVPQKIERLRNVLYPGGIDLQYVIKELAQDLDLNVLFDTESRLDNRKAKIELRQVSSAKALDYLFLQENLFFQRVGPRTILVATGNRRTNFQQLVLRTFYLANASPKDIKAVITSAIPAQPGRSQTIVLEDASTNSITIRDTEENVRLIGRLISSLDKDRAEVVMDVAIYEVNKNDLLQFGNQLGVASGQGSTLTNIGGVGFPIVRGGPTGQVTNGFPFRGTDALSFAIGLPISSISALQTKNNTKLIASTQIHAFNNEDSSARIGQRVPVRTATISNGFNNGNNNNNSGFLSDVINYEQVGLTLKFKPIVFPNQDVQVNMEIESKDVSGANTFTPTFTERTIKGMARVQNNKTLLLASVAQDVESNGRSGLPLIGLIPIIGRLFTAPTRDNRQVDIVIAITPRVIRAPAILPEDEVERPTGSLATPTNSSLEAMIVEEEREELLASARKLPTTAQVQLPDQPTDAPTYVRTNGSAPASTETGTTAQATTNVAAGSGLNLKPIDTTPKTLDVTKTADTSVLSPPTTDPGTESPKPPVSDLQAQLTFASALPQLKAGEKARIAVNVNSGAQFRSAVLGVKFDDTKLAVRSVSYGDLFGVDASKLAVAPFINQGGKMYVSLSPGDKAPTATSGVIAYIEVEALADGQVDLTLDKDILSLIAMDGKYIAVRP